MAERVFVYGTLRRGARNGHLLAGARWLGAATVRGRLYPLGWYPGLVLDASGDVVLGDLFELDDPRLLARLDAYEGCGAGDPEPHEYRRLRQPVATGSGVVEAWLWVWQPLPGVALPEPVGGDWLAVGDP